MKKIKFDKIFKKLTLIVSIKLKLLLALHISLLISQGLLNFILFIIFLCSYNLSLLFLLWSLGDSKLVDFGLSHSSYSIGTNNFFSSHMKALLYHLIHTFGLLHASLHPYVLKFSVSEASGEQVALILNILIPLITFQVRGDNEVPFNALQKGLPGKSPEFWRVSLIKDPGISFCDLLLGEEQVPSAKHPLQLW